MSIHTGGKIVTNNEKSKDDGKSDFLSNDPGKVDSNFFCYAATVLSQQQQQQILLKIGK